MADGAREISQGIQLGPSRLPGAPDKGNQVTVQQPSLPMRPRQRLLAVLRGSHPDRVPFVSRLEMWHRAHQRTGTLPEAFRQSSLIDIHRSVGMGQLKFMNAYALRLRGVEVTAELNGEGFYRERDPVIENFPGMWDVVATDRPGITFTRLITPVGSLTLRHEITPTMVETGADPYLREHLIKGVADYPAVEYILEHAEYLPQYGRLQRAADEMGDDGFLVPLLHRIPFQQLLLEYLGETELFFALHDDPARVERLLHLLDLQLKEILDHLAEWSCPYVEFPDNLHGLMTNPKLFTRYCLRPLQEYTSILHGQGKKVGSHTDGNVRPLLGLLARSGLDVCESFSPRPLTDCTLEEAWEAWREGPLIWGGIPSPYLEERTAESEFEAYLDHLMELAATRPIILGIVDLFMRHNQIERVRRIARRIEVTPLNWPMPGSPPAT